MSSVGPRYRRPLNTEQIEILELLYKFRFGTVPLFKDYFAETNPGMDVFRRLSILEERGFIAKGYLSNYKLLHKPVAYCLLPEGARELARHRDPDDNAVDLKAIYRNKDASESFITHCLQLFVVYNRLTARYGDDLEFLAKSDLVGLDNLPKQLPDALLTLHDKQEDRYFFLDVIDSDQPPFVVTKRVKQFLDYRQSGGWATVGTRFPVIVLVCDSDSLCDRAQKRAEAALKKSWVSDVVCRVVTKDAISLADV